ncbi:MAG: hypothetical protein A4E28_01138 [Methanocella sp. PtaU1.Bin125]|nr:MAG: hypothetical protein A4E28_01138 [Methanocella sp. PtaU1.Bin125]
MSAFGAVRGAGIAVARAFAVTVTMAALMMLMALGFMHLLSGEASLPVSTAIVLVVFALSFVASAVLLDRAGTGQVQSLIAGAVIAMGMTILILTVYSGIIFVQNGGLDSLDLETLLYGFAASLIVSVIVDRLVLKI